MHLQLGKVMKLASVDMLWAIVKNVDRYSHLNFSLIDQIIVSGANFIMGILLARHLGVSQFGQFSLVWLVVQFIQAAQSSTIILPMMSIGPKQPADTHGAYYSIVFIHQFIFASLSTALVMAALLLSDQVFRGWNIRPLLWPLSAMVFADQTQGFLRRYFFSVSKWKMSLIIDLVRYGGQTLAFLCLFLFFSWEPDLAGVLWAMLVAASVSILAAWCRIDNVEWSLAEWKNVTLRHWHFAKWLIGVCIAGWMSGELCYVFIAAVLGSSAVGILKAAQTVMGVTNVFFQGMQNFMPVRASIVYREGGVIELVKFLRKCSFVIVLATLAIAAIVCIYPNYVMKLLYGPQYRDYGWVLVGYAMIYIMIASGVVPSLGLLTLEKTYPTLLAFIISGIILIGIIYPLVAYFGLAGGLIGLAVYPAVQLLVQFCALRKLVTQSKKSGRKSPTKRTNDPGPSFVDKPFQTISE
jgi:O-antigen/teichoic acid export membrane protein